MKTNLLITKWLTVLAFSIISLQSATTFAQGTTAFTYQGQLHDGGTNANGTYTMLFKLYDAVANGNQIGSTITTSPTLANGLFTVNLDFGAGAFNGSARWLDITVTNGPDTQTLSPRVQVLPAPYAQFAAVAATVTNGAIMNAQLANNSVATANIQDGTVTDAKIVSVSGGKVTGTVASATNASLLDGLSTNSFAMHDDLTNYVRIDGLTNITAVPDIQVFDANGTFIVPNGVTKITVEVWGGGGGGGATGIMGGILNSGGGGGGYGKGVFGVSPGDSYSVTVGLGGGPNNQGGASSFGSLITATGGLPGANGYEVVGGVGGSSDALINITGGSGGSIVSMWSGDGGNAGCGGSGGRGGYDAAGPESGQVPGGGGGGGYGPSTVPLGFGGDGRVIVYY